MTRAVAHTDRAHALLGASSCDRWWNCPGSVRLIAELPRAQSSEWAAAGTLFHEVMEQVLRTRRAPAEFHGRGEYKLIDGHPVTVDDEMVEAADEALDALREVLALDPDDVVLIEVRFSLANLNPPAPMFGTADLVIWKAKARRLIVVDFKYGQGVAVEADDNPQLMYYALGAMVARPQWRPRMIEIVVVQPRAYHRKGPIRSWSLFPDELVEWSVYLLARAKATTRPDAELQPGDWCRWCPALAICPAQASKALAVARTEFDDLDSDSLQIPPSPEGMTPDQLARVLDHADLFTGWLNAVRSHATAELEAGRSIPGYGLVDKKSRRKWKTPSDVITTAPALLGIRPGELFEPPTMKSPAQLEKAVGKKAFRALSNLISQESTGRNLVRIEGSTRPLLPARITTDFEVLSDD